MAVGIVLGVALGGRLQNLGDATFTLWPLLLAGLVVQASAGFVGENSTIANALVLASYVLLLAFALANVRLIGMGVIAIGIVLNFVPIAANAGMPVRTSAIVAAGIAEEDEIERIDFGNKRHLERPDDRFTILGDIIPVPIAEEVLSFGDLVMSVGVAAVLVRLLRGGGGGTGKRIRRERQRTSASPGIG